jgi:hypothetical protein
MCFSAEASFSSAALLAGISWACTTQITSKRQYALVVMPFLLAIMQGIEGFAWLGFHRQLLPGFFIPLAMFYFLVVTFFLWPIWSSASLLLLEKNNTRKKWLQRTLCLACLLDVVMFCYLWKYPDFSVSVVNRSIQYLFFVRYEWFELTVKLLVSFLTIVPFFLSSVRGHWLTGIVALGSWIITAWLYSYAFVSIWCFLGTAASICVFRMLYLERVAPRSD